MKRDEQHNLIDKPLHEFEAGVDTIYIQKTIGGFMYNFLCTFSSFERGVVKGMIKSCDRGLGYYDKYKVGGSITARANKCYLYGASHVDAVNGQPAPLCHWFCRHGNEWRVNIRDRIFTQDEYNEFFPDKWKIPVQVQYSEKEDVAAVDTKTTMDHTDFMSELQALLKNGKASIVAPARRTGVLVLSIMNGDGEFTDFEFSEEICEETIRHGRYKPVKQ